MEPWSVAALSVVVVLIAAYILLIATMSLDKFALQVVIITLCTSLLAFGWAEASGYGFLAIFAAATLGALVTIAVTNTSKDFREEDRRSAPVLSPESDTEPLLHNRSRSLTVLDESQVQDASFKHAQRKAGAEDSAEQVVKGCIPSWLTDASDNFTNAVNFVLNHKYFGYTIQASTGVSGAFGMWIAIKSGGGPISFFMAAVQLLDTLAATIAAADDPVKKASDTSVVDTSAETTPRIASVSAATGAVSPEQWRELMKRHRHESEWRELSKDFEELQSNSKKAVTCADGPVSAYLALRSLEHTSSHAITLVEETATRTADGELKKFAPVILDGAYKAGEVVAEKVRTVPALGTLINPGTYLLSDDIFLADAMEHLPKANKRISEFIHEQWEAGMSSLGAQVRMSPIKMLVALAGVVVAIDEFHLSYSDVIQPMVDKVTDVVAPITNMIGQLTPTWHELFTAGGTCLHCSPDVRIERRMSETEGEEAVGVEEELVEWEPTETEAEEEGEEKKKKNGGAGGFGKIFATAAGAAATAATASTVVQKNVQPKKTKKAIKKEGVRHVTVVLDKKQAADEKKDKLMALAAKADPHLEKRVEFKKRLQPLGWVVEGVPALEGVEGTPAEPTFLVSADFRGGAPKTMPKVLGFGVEMPRGTWLVCTAGVLPGNQDAAGHLLKVKSVATSLGAAREAAMGWEESGQTDAPPVLLVSRESYIDSEELQSDIPHFPPISPRNLGWDYLEAVVLPAEPADSERNPGDRKLVPQKLAELQLMVSAWKAKHRPPPKPKPPPPPKPPDTPHDKPLSPKMGFISAQAALNHIDQLNARFIFRDSFDAGATTKPALPHLSEVQIRSKLRPIFDQADLNQNGEISTKEFGALVKSLNLDFTDEQMAAMTADADRNNNGEVDFDEFVAALKVQMKAGGVLADLFTGSSNFLLANELDPDGDRRPIHWAAAKGNMKAIKVLLRAGADLEATDISGRTAEELAELNGHHEVARFLNDMASVQKRKEFLDLKQTKTRRRR